MSETAQIDRIQQLDQRHVQLLDDLDSLNARLEAALNCFVKPSEADSEPTGANMA